MQSTQKNINKILIVTLSNLGDVVLTLPVFQAIKDNFPKAEIHVIVGQSAQAVFENDSRIAKVILYNRRIPLSEKIKFILNIRRERYDLIIDLRRSLVGFFGGARLRNKIFVFSRKTEHKAARHLKALANIAAADDHAESFLKIDPHASAKIDSLVSLDQRKLIVVAPGSKSDIKKWPAEYYARLLDRLAANKDYRVVFAGDANDAKDAAQIKKQMLGEALDLSGKTNFKELAALLERACLLITNDSAPLHIADALKTPVLAIFGPTDPRKYGPRQTGSLVASRPIFCSPCEKAQCRYHHECMKELGVDEVYKKATQILNDEFQPQNLKVLVIRLDRIGDVVLSLPAVEAIKNRFPNASISMMVRPYTAGLVEGHPLVDEVIPYFYQKKGRHRFPLGYLRLIQEIVKRRFDVVFILHPGIRSFLIPFLAGIPYRVGFETRWPFLLTRQVRDRRGEGLKHESEYALDVVRAFGIDPPKQKKVFIPTYPDDEARVSRLIDEISQGKKGEIVAFHAGASCPSKRWPEERFAELGKKVMAQTPYRIALVGGSEEKELSASIKEKLGGNVIDLTGKLNLKELAVFLKRCRLLVTNDSGPVHVAAAVGTPTLCIFGRNRAGLGPQRWKALGEGHQLIHKDVGCVVCLAHRCTIGFECLKAVQVEEVFAMLRKMLMEPASKEGANK